MEKLKISVITICFNNLEELKSTIETVDFQSTKPFEHLIIDGSTNQEIEAYLLSNTQPDYRIWICEPDNGIADAFNKGVAKSEGNIINFLNSGDEFYDSTTIQIVLEKFKLDSSLKWLHGAYVFFRGGIWLHAGTPFRLDMLYKGMRQISHQSIFAKKELFDKHGTFNESKKVAMDFDWLARVAEERGAYINYPLCKFYPDGISGTNVWGGLKEVSESYEKYRGFSIKQKAWKIRAYLLFQFTQKTTFGKMLFQLKNKSSELKK